MLRDMIKILEFAQHTNIVRLEDYFENKDVMFICLELHSKMTLFDYILKFKDRLEESRIQELGKKIGSALEYLHDNGVVLKNLESSGILMTEQMDEHMLDKSVPRISRLSKAEITGYGSYVHGIEGDHRFRAPEVMLGKSYDSKADTWSCGVIMFHLLAGRLPFGESTKDHTCDSKSVEEAI